MGAFVLPSKSMNEDLAMASFYSLSNVAAGVLCIMSKQVLSGHYFFMKVVLRLIQRGLRYFQIHCVKL